jgi:hypothetical protein
MWFFSIPFHRNSALEPRRRTERRAERHPRHRRPLQLEVLEHRLSPAVLTVNTTADNTTDTSVLTLRDAITLANSAGDPYEVVPRPFTSSRGRPI